VIILIDWDAIAWDRDSRAFSAGPNRRSRARESRAARSIRVNEIALISDRQASVKVDWRCLFFVFFFFFFFFLCFRLCVSPLGLIILDSR